MSFIRITQIVLVLVLLGEIANADGPRTIENIAEDAIQGIVSIKAQTKDGVSSGTGFVVDPTGVLVTNLHVIEGANQVLIKAHGGETFTRAQIMSFDDARDIVIIRVPGFDLHTMELGNSDELKVGARVVAVGNPLGLEDTVTTGIVSSVRVNENGSRVIQTDTAVSPGNSGGPLINLRGQVVGVVTYKRRGGENLNFAIPINYVRALLPFDDRMTLESLNAKLAERKYSFTSGEVKQDLISVSGNWLSLTDNSSQRLRQDGENVYGEFSKNGYIGKFDLEWQGDNRYEGVVRTTLRTSYIGKTGPVRVSCEFSEDVEINVESFSRMSGWINWTPRPTTEEAMATFLRTCGKSERSKRARAEFVWVRGE